MVIMNLTHADLGRKVLKRDGTVNTLVLNPNRNKYEYPFKAGSYSYGPEGKWCCAPKTKDHDLDILEFVE